MVKHIVMWRLKEEAAGNGRSANAELVKERLEALRGRIPGLLAIEVGLDFSASDSSMDVVLYTELEDRQALADYQAHPEHQALVPFIREVAAERRVVDYEI